jgi:hypothetical protein
VLAFSPAQAAVVFNFANFAGACGTALTCVGNTATPGNDLRLTSAGPNQAGAGYSNTAITLGANATFSTSFQFRITNPGGINPADGLTFVLSAGSGGLGASGGGIGYQGVNNSLAIEFDTFNNGGADANSSNHIGVNQNGSLNSSPLVNPYGRSTCDFAAGSTYLNPGCMANGNIWTVFINYDGALLDVVVQDGSAAQFVVINDLAINIAGVLGSTNAFVGFTSGTGAGWANHDILNWQLANDTSIVPPPASGVPEPGSLALAGVALLGAGLARRRARSRQG